MKIWIVAAFLLLLVSCVETRPPEVTPAMAQSGKGRHMGTVELQRGRTLFAYRCIECHTLPAIASHTESEWPHLVDKMAGRASLKPADREAVLAYILAAHSQESK